MNTSVSHRFWSVLALSWNEFVCAFLYYTVLALVAVSGAELSGVFVFAAYAAPPAAYALIVLVRAVRALASVPVDLFHPPHALAR